MSPTRIAVLLALSAHLPLVAKQAENPPVQPASEVKQAEKVDPAGKADQPDQKAEENPAAQPADKKQPSAAKQEQEELAEKNALAAEKLKLELADLSAQVARLKLEKEMLSEQAAIEKLKLVNADEAASKQYQQELLDITRESELAKAKALHITNQLKAEQAMWGMKTAQLKAEVDELEMLKKRREYSNSDPVYLENPLKEDGTLVISDRRIALNGPISYGTADYITERINYYNNQDADQPIFIVIDTSPGGSVMAGYRILKAMEGSSAPIHVVVKSFAASMAASITTLAEHSYAYPNAIILHHQISSTFFFQKFNLTEQKEFYEDMQKWWQRLATPIAAKMGITTDEFIEQMYKNSSKGDWSEFAEDAQKLKWVDHIVERLQETSLIKDPNAKAEPTKTAFGQLEQQIDESGKPFVQLPRLTPKDFYFLYSPDQYYRAY
ncbi:ClpP family protease [Persicirhabdus sediminis]|uniref:ATP-dependent Clp protease proteolytic subunit n=1 Tax=Persicirhabdus sediminis TaxID=454144 RepID=A0A8J7MG23_9BACT|nr:ATP-dependent Clp protease proteolytic subunit [Persicirhabdus sediminis]MBK1792372.1 ATP-dependent Clp protease proteolytic subunit [Persicirhabdus sediminis]